MAACNVYDILSLGSHHDRFTVAAYEDDGDDWSNRPTSESAKKDAFLVD